MTADDVKVGQIVTVLDWFCNRESKAGWVEPDPFAAMFSRAQPAGQRRDFMGVVLRVEAVSLPYVALTKAYTKEHVTLDLRLCEIVAVSPAFIAAAAARHEQEKNKKPSTYGLLGWSGPIITRAEPDDDNDEDDEEPSK